MISVLYCLELNQGRNDENPIGINVCSCYLKASCCVIPRRSLIKRYGNSVRWWVKEVNIQGMFKENSVWSQLLMTMIVNEFINACGAYILGK